MSRRGAVLDSLEALEARGELDGATKDALEEAVAMRRAILIAGPRSARSTDFVAALARAWHDRGRVALLADAQSLLPGLGVADLLLDGAAVGAAVALASEVLIAEEPTPSTWAQLLLSGRPFVATVEAADATSALQRAVALALAGNATLSRAAGEGLLGASLGVVLELSAAGEGPARGAGRPSFVDGHLTVASTPGPSRPPDARRSKPPTKLPERVATPADTRPTPVPPRVTPSVRPQPASAIRRPSSRPFSPLGPPSKPPPTRELERPVELPSMISRALSSSAATPDDRGDLSDILPESLLSTSFIGRFDSSDADPTKRGEGADLAGQTLPPSQLPSGLIQVDERQEVPTPDLDGTVDGSEPLDDDDFSDEETAGTKELDRRPAERQPTVTLPPPTQRPRLGVGNEVWAAREFKRSQDVDLELGGEDGIEAAEPHTAAGDVLKSDPFEINLGDDTFHADGHEMISTGSYEPDLIEAHPDDVRDSRVESLASGIKPRNGTRNEWDEEAPSEIIEPNERGKVVDPRRVR